MDPSGRLLSLKVMRVSRPTLASAWEPFYSSSPSFSAHSTASLLSLQGSTPLAGHPKTLRDLSNVSELLTLASSFGAIQLGETFSGALAVNNETTVPVDGVTLRVEMQTATTKVLLCELGGPTQRLEAGDTIESVVHHEIKELGQHVLACTVSYLLPPGVAAPPQDAATGGDSNVQTFRKFYKFAVTNPLSVKTKVHTPRSPSALLSRLERDKVFLEVHLQNLTQDPVYFEQIVLDPAQSWQVEDGKASDSGFGADVTALMHPQDTRQYIFILGRDTPSPPNAPGSMVPLGRLNLTWRSSMGEPGRLLTSMLYRRVPPLPAVQAPLPRQPASALPLHLQRSNTVAPTPGHQTPISPSSPVPYRPGSPFRARQSTTIPRPQSPATSVATPAIANPDALDVDLIVHDAPKSAELYKPFTIPITVTISAPVPPTPSRERILSIAVQHIPSNSSAATPAPPNPSRTRPFSIDTPLSPVPSTLDNTTLVGSPSQQTFTLLDGAADTPALPRPGDASAHTGAHPVGASCVFGPPVRLRVSAPPAPADDTSDTSDDSAESAAAAKRVRAVGAWDFVLEFVPVRAGFVRVGGVRVVLVEDRVEDVEEGARAVERVRGAGVKLREWDVVAEVWVNT